MQFEVQQKSLMKPFYPFFIEKSADRKAIKATALITPVHFLGLVSSVRAPLLHMISLLNDIFLTFQARFHLS